MLELHVHLTTLSLSQDEDSYEWVIDGTKALNYNTGQIYHKLKGETARVTWSKVVWTSGGIPKHNFLTWLFVLNRCPTRDKLLSWGLSTDASCLLCNASPETRDHLFYQCPYASAIWGHLARRCSLIPLGDWNQTLHQMMSLQGNKYIKRLTFLCWQASIYWLWQERNNRLHNRHFRSTDSLLPLIYRQIEDRMLSYRQQPITSSRTMKLWFSTEPQPSLPHPSPS